MAARFHKAHSDHPNTSKNIFNEGKTQLTQSETQLCMNYTSLWRICSLSKLLLFFFSTFFCFVQIDNNMRIKPTLSSCLKGFKCLLKGTQEGVNCSKWSKFSKSWIETKLFILKYISFDTNIYIWGELLSVTSWLNCWILTQEDIIATDM